MTKTHRVILIVCAVIFSSALSTSASDSIRINGSVRIPLTISIHSLEKLGNTEVQLNEICKDGRFNGIFKFRGMPLRDLLDLVIIEKKETNFNKLVDMAILVKNKTGQMVTLSWGEVFFKNGDDVLIAVSAHPIFPRKGIDQFMEKEAYHEMMQALNRKIEFPKLVVCADFYADRAIEMVSEITILDLHLDVTGHRAPDTYSEAVTIHGDVEKSYIFNKLPDHRSTRVTTHIVGERSGFHGTHEFSGISIKELILSARPQLGLNTVFLISAPDAYRALLSYGELFLTPHANRILLTNKRDDAPIAQHGKFVLVVPDDLMVDREVRAVKRIEVISLESYNK